MYEAGEQLDGKVNLCICHLVLYTSMVRAGCAGEAHKAPLLGCLIACDNKNINTAMYDALYGIHSGLAFQVLLTH